LGDDTTKTDNVTTLATQIGLEVLEAGYRLVMTDRVGVDATVRKRLAPYCAAAGVKAPMLIAASQGVKSKQEHVISVSDSHQQLEEFLKKADVLILAQKDGTSDPVFASGVVKERAKKQGVPVIEPFADLDATKPFFVPDVAREMVALAKKVCARV